MLGQRLYDLRRKQGLSQEQLAEKINVSRQTVSKWESGQSTPDLPKLLALAEVYSLSLDELVGNTPPSPAPEPTQTTDPQPETSLFPRIAGLFMCLLGIACLLLAVVILFIDPQAEQSIAGSFAITIDGFGVVYGMSALAVIVGVYLMIRKP